jgi:uncharacterized membrane protein
MLRPGEGITASVSVPKGIFIPYRFSWWELYGSYLWFLLPLVTFMYCYRTWRKYGDDPSWDSIVIPEYEAPNNLDALELGMLSTNGTLSNEFVTAGIIELAVRGVLKIREEKNKILFFTTTDYVLEKTPSSNVALASHQSLLLDRLFESADSVKLSDLKNKFYKNLGEIGKSVTGSLAEKGLIEKQGLSYRTKFMGGGIVLIFLSVFISGAAGLPVSAIFSGAVSGILVIYFGVIMPKRTLQGVEANWKIKGLKLFMEKAEKHRQQFYEKENMFETLLPYAIVFGMTGEWIKKMRDIYGEAYFTGYHPAWFMASDMGNFDVDNFSASMESLSSAIADNTGTSSGSGGSGSSGGGGGGGGGGGW